ncbi:MAG: ACT domain-containing protein, partial [Acidimicrobiia bacterium]|nr:ACT domain-containing protein [Acidimicrobiia bacterium]
MIELVLTIIGRDRAGVVASLADVIRFHEGNWKRSELAEIAGTFAGVVVVEVGDDRVDELLTNLLVLR